MNKKIHDVDNQIEYLKGIRQGALAMCALVVSTFVAVGVIAFIGWLV